MGACIKPSIAAPDQLDMQRLFIKVALQKRGDLQLSARRRGELCRALWCGAVEKVKTGHRIGRRRLAGFLDNLPHLPVCTKIQHAIAFRVDDPVAKDSPPLPAFRRA